MQDDPTNLDPDGFLIGHAFKGEFLYLRFRRARDVASRVGVWPLRSRKNFTLHTGIWRP